MYSIDRIFRGMGKLAVRMMPEAWLTDRRAARTQTVVLGSGDGAWRVPRTLTDGVIGYCVGIGRDASFDLELASRLQARVFSFDPTPTSVEFMQELPDSPLEFHPWGVWSADQSKTLYHQDRWDDVNLTVIDPGEDRGGQVVEAPFYRLGTIMQKLGHERIDLLKLDVEGAWWEILNAMLDDGIVPAVLCVEFDSPTSPLKVWRMVRRLARHGLLLAGRDRDDYLFVDLASDRVAA